MKLYHGSNTKIESINLAMCRPYKENEMIDFSALMKGMIYKKTSSQYSFHTEKSIRLLRKVEN